MKDFRYRTKEESDDHVIERLKDRYGIEITVDELNEINTTEDYTGVFKKNQDKSIGFINIKGRRVWVMRSYDNGILTALPPEIETHDEQMLISCFYNYTRAAANEIYQQIMTEIHDAPTHFETAKEAWFYYKEHYTFNKHLMHVYKEGEYDPWRIMRTIKRILSDRHWEYRLEVVKR